jgi:dephospho-CoA kinase
MRVALTGGVATGKSTVTSVLRDLGVVVIDSDELAREVVEPGTRGLEAVVASFGPSVLADDGRLDRAALGAVVFADEGRRRELEGILHPLIRRRAAALEEAAGEGTLVVHDIPLLVETGQAGAFDAVVVVDVPVETQVERMVHERGWSEADARARIAAQAGREERLAVATHVVDNTGTRDDLRDRVTEVVEALRSSGGG